MEETPAPAREPLAWLKRNASWLALAFALVFFVLPRVSPFEPLNDYLNVAQRLSEWVLRKLEVLFTDYGYYVVFFGVLLENSMFLGLLVPGAVILILAGLAAENGSINLWLVLVIAVGATVAGDSLSYLVGRLGWTRALERGAMAGALQKVRGTMESNHTWIILAYHFAGYSRVVGPAAAGLFRIPYRRWAPLDYTGGTLWVLAYTLFGVLLGAFGLEFGDTERMVRLLELFFTGALVAALAVAIYRSVRARQGVAAQGAVAVPVDGE